jgi:hypothetical protein
MRAGPREETLGEKSAAASSTIVGGAPGSLVGISHSFPDRMEPLGLEPR